MKIYEVKEKSTLLPLLLLADEQQSMVEKYINDVAVYVLDDGGVKGEIAVLESNGEIEIKNLAVLPEYQGRGYGKKLIEYVCNLYKDRNKEIIVGTGESPLTLPFYEKCGFEKCGVIKNFFTDNYDKPIIEGGVLLADMIYLKRKL